MMMMSWCCDGDDLTDVAVVVAVVLTLALAGAVLLIEGHGCIAIISIVVAIIIVDGSW